MALGNQDTPESVINQSRTGVNGISGSLRYPSEHGRYFTMIRFVKYQRTNPKRIATQVSQADIILPLPANLMEYYAIQYGDESFNQLGGLTSSVENRVNQYMKDGGFSTAVVEGAAVDFTEWSQAMARGTANYFSPEASSLLDRFQGNVVNPHITSIFKGVGLREHQLSWRLHAKDARESADIKKIRDFVRERMHPEKKSEFLLNFPDEVYVKFYANGKEFLYPIFKAVITSCSAELSSDGTNAFFKDTDEPVIVTFNITLKEVEAATREDFTSISLAGADVRVDDTETVRPTEPVRTYRPAAPVTFSDPPRLPGQ
jgi:hypothetical protein